MVRYEDVPSTHKHIRFGKISESIYKALIGFPGVKSIVLHEGGSKGGSYKEHPHYHVWYETEKPQTNQTIRNNLKKMTEFVDFSGQQDWSFRNHDNIENWAKYVISNPTYKVLLTHVVLEKAIKEKAEEIPVVVLKDLPLQHVEGLQEAVKTVPRKSRAERLKLKEHLREIWHWKENGQFDIHQYKSAMAMCKARIIEWYSGWLDDRDGIRMLRFLMWTFGTDKLREELSDKISYSWDKYV